MAVLIKIRFEFTRLFEPQNDVKIEFISIQARGGAIEGGGGITGCIFLQVCRPITGGTGL